MTSSAFQGFAYYISLVKNRDLQSLYSAKEAITFLSAIPEEKSNHRYAPCKWSIKQRAGHIADHERIMVYRALRFSRKDPTLLPGYDQDILVNNAPFERLPFKDLIEDLHLIRNSSIRFINNLSEAQYDLKGTASGLELSVRDALVSIVGHELHHMNILKERYL